MLLVTIAWVYVVLMAAVAEAGSPNGTLLGAFVTLLLYGVLPLGLGGYLFFSPARRRARRAAQARSASGIDPDHGGHPPGDAFAPVREEPRRVADAAPVAAADRPHPGRVQPVPRQAGQVGQPLAGLPRDEAR